MCNRKKNIWPKVWIDHTITFYWGFGLLGCKMAQLQSQILTIPQWFLLPSGSQIVVITIFMRITSLFYFLHQHNSKTEFCSRFVPKEYSTPVKETSTKVIHCHKNCNYNDHCGTVRSILPKNEGGCFCLCQNSLAFTLPVPTTVAPVEHTLAILLRLDLVQLL